MLTRKLLLTLGLAIVLAVAGCIVSGTFMVVETFSYTGSNPSGVYPLAVNITDNEVWDDHKDDIDKIEVVGFEVWITNSGSPFTFTAYMDEFGGTLHDNVADVEDSTTQVLEPVSVPLTVGSFRIISYKQSFDYLTNTEALRDFVESGKFNYFGILSGPSVSGQVDSVTIILTLNAGK